MTVRPGERRVLVLAPVGKDAALIAASLGRAQIQNTPCPTMGALLRELEAGAGAVVLTEEALTAGDFHLAQALERQPPWSDLPILILTRTGADSEVVSRAIGLLGNVTLLERPVRSGALLAAARSALRARDRQYQARAYMAERDEANERKDQFLATLAHELRNPLAPIRTGLHCLRLAGAGAGAEEYCEIMERQVTQMVRLVDDLLDLSRITRGKIELRREKVPFAAVIAAAVETSRPLIDAAGHELILEVPRQPWVLDADPVRLAQVFSNLLNNAAKYTDQGGRIELNAKAQDEQLVVAIRDNGIGMTPQVLATVFDMFVQANAADGRAQGGLGIGLTLVRTLVGMHGGTVEASSDGPGKGSLFVVRLPLAEAAEATAAPRRQAGTLARHRILVVDDNRDAADTLAALLHAMGAEAMAAYGGNDALELARSFHPSVCLLDLGMPGMDGYELASRLRRLDATGDATLVALSGWGQTQARERARATGFAHHLTKPVDSAVLQQLLASLPAKTFAAGVSLTG